MLNQLLDGGLLLGLLLPLFGTTLGAGCVFFLKRQIHPLVQKALLGFASGVMVAAAVWSLLIPAMDQSAHLGRLAFLPAAVGFLLGMAFLLLMDQLVPHLHLGSEKAEGPNSSFKRLTMLVLAVTLHNIPEGMAVGVVFAGMLTGHGEITLTGAFALSIGIAIQNFPEGAIISLPLKSEGASRGRAFLYCSPEWWNLQAPCLPFCWPLRSPLPSPTSWPSPPEPCSMWWWRSSSPRPARESTPTWAPSASPWVLP